MEWLLLPGVHPKAADFREESVVSARREGVQDKRVLRTRERVMESARDILTDSGVAALNYTSLSLRSGVTRPTLYQHWPTIQSLLLELMHHAPDQERERSTDAMAVLVAFLRTFDESMADPSSAAVLVSLMGQAEQDEVVEQQLKGLAGSRLVSLNQQLELTGLVVDEDRLASMIGPLVFRRFIARVPATTEFITGIAASVLHSITNPR
jgi:AcrR family transcriptional regulator